MPRGPKWMLASEALQSGDATFWSLIIFKNGGRSSLLRREVHLCHRPRAASI